MSTGYAHALCILVASLILVKTNGLWHPVAFFFPKTWSTRSLVLEVCLVTRENLRARSMIILRSVWRLSIIGHDHLTLLVSAPCHKNFGRRISIMATLPIQFSSFACTLRLHSTIRDDSSFMFDFHMICERYSQ